MHECGGDGRLFSGRSRNVWYRIISYHIIKLTYHIVDVKRQSRLKVRTDKRKPKVKVQSVSDDDVRKRLLEKPRFELGKCYILRQSVPVLWASNRKSTATDG